MIYYCQRPSFQILHTIKLKESLRKPENNIVDLLSHGVTVCFCGAKLWKSWVRNLRGAHLSHSSISGNKMFLFMYYVSVIFSACAVRFHVHFVWGNKRSGAHPSTGSHRSQSEFLSCAVIVATFGTSRTMYQDARICLWSWASKQQQQSITALEIRSFVFSKVTSPSAAKLDFVSRSMPATERVTIVWKDYIFLIFLAGSTPRRSTCSCLICCLNF